MSHVFWKILSLCGLAWLVLQIYSFVFFSAFGVICKKNFFPANGLKTFFTLCRSVTLLGSTLKVYDPFWLNFLHGVRCGSKVTARVGGDNMDIQLLQYLFPYKALMNGLLCQAHSSQNTPWGWAAPSAWNSPTPVPFLDLKSNHSFLLSPSFGFNLLFFF